MTLNIPGTPTTGTDITISGFGTPVRDSLLWVATDAGACRVYNSAAQSIPNTTLTAITFDSERFDVGGCHSTSSNTSRITVPTNHGGKWVIGGSVEFASNVTGYRQCEIRLNGTTIIASQMAGAINGTVTRLSVAAEYALAAGDYVELMVAQTSGGALNVQSTGNLSPEFWAYWVRT